MSSTSNKNILKRFWALAFFSLFFFAGICCAQDPERALPVYYPEQFNAIGSIDRIGEDEIVISDILYRFSFTVTYHTLTKMYAPKELFSTGSRVGVMIDPKHEVTFLWLLE